MYSTCDLDKQDRNQFSSRLLKYCVLISSDELMKCLSKDHEWLVDSIVVAGQESWKKQNSC